MKYRFEHKFFYEDSRLGDLNKTMKSFGIPGKFGYEGSLGHTDVIINLKPGQEIVPLTDEQNERVRKEIESALKQHIGRVEMSLTVKTSKGVLLA